MEKYDEKKTETGPTNGCRPVTDYRYFFLMGSYYRYQLYYFWFVKKKKSYTILVPKIFICMNYHFSKKNNNGKRKKCMESFYINQPRISCICSRLIFYTYKSFSLSYTCFNKSIVDNYLFFMNSKLDEKTI